MAHNMFTDIKINTAIPTKVDFRKRIIDTSGNSGNESIQLFIGQSHHLSGSADSGQAEHGVRIPGKAGGIGRCVINRLRGGAGTERGISVVGAEKVARDSLVGSLPQGILSVRLDNGDAVDIVHTAVDGVGGPVVVQNRFIDERDQQTVAGQIRVPRARVPGDVLQHVIL